VKSQNEDQKTDLNLKDEFSEVESAITNLVKQKLLPDKYIKHVSNIKNLIPGLQADPATKDNILITKVLFRISSDGKVLYLSSSCDDLLGYKPDEMIGDSIFNFVAPSEKPQYFFLTKKMLKENTIFQFKTKLVHKEGKEVFVDVKASIQKEKGKRFVLGSVNEILQKKENKEKINTNEVIFKTVWENSQHGIRLTDSKGIIYLCNQSFARMVKKNIDELIGQPISSVYDSKIDERVMNDYKLDMASGNIKVRVESSMKLWNGDLVEVEITNTLIKDAGKHKYLLSLFRDITQKKRDDEIIKRKDQLLQGIAEASKLLISSKEEKDEFHGALGILGKAAEVDRVSIYQHLIDEQTQEMYFSIIHEWASDDVEHQINSPYFKKISYSRFTGLQFYENFSKGNPLRFTIDKLPQFSRDEFMDKQIKSIMLVPIMIEDEYWGFIGFDDIKTDREWTDDEESILIIMASTLGAVIKRNLFKEDLLRKNIELKKSAKQAEHLSQLKSEFLSLMSHEIRTPLNGVLGMIDLLLDTKLELDQKDYANTIKLSGEQLLSVINNILDFSKIESGKLEIEKGPFDLRECIEDSFDLLSLKASEKELELIYAIEAETPGIIIGDVIRLRQILTNLISNGIKFTDKGIVKVSVKPKNIDNNSYELQFCVKDTGIGIPGEKLDRLFKPFSQIDPVDSRSYGGSGLGLVVAKKLVEMMNGTMWVESEYGKGTSFYFNILTEISDVNLTGNNTGESIFTKRKFLVYSTNDAILSSIETQLNNWGIISLKASEENKIFKILASKETVDVIIYDIDSFSKDSSNNFIELKEKSESLQIPIIFLAPFGKSIEELNIFDSSTTRILSKPLKFSFLDYVLRDFLNKSLINKNDESIEPVQSESIKEAELLKILLIEQSKEYQAIASQIIQGTGYTVHSVSNIDEAQEALNHESYFMVLIDSSLTGEGFEQFTEETKNKNSRMEFVVMVDGPVDGQDNSFKDRIILKFISKPLRFDDVERLFNNIESTPENGKAPKVEPEPDNNKNYISELTISSLFDFNTDEDYKHYIALLEVYLKDLPDLAEMIDLSIKAKDFKKLKFYSHKLGGSIKNLGVEKVVNMCYAFEEAAKNKVIDESVINLNFEFQKVMNKILSEISELRFRQSNIN